LGYQAMLAGRINSSDSESESHDPLGYQKFLAEQNNVSDSDSEPQRESPITKNAHRLLLSRCKIRSCCSKTWCHKNDYDKYDIQLLRQYYHNLSTIDQRQFLQNRVDETASPRRFYLDDFRELRKKLEIRMKSKRRVCSRYFFKAVACSHDKVNLRRLPHTHTHTHTPP
jgi:hypothetical protein